MGEFLSYEKTICFTIDVEPDFGGLIETDVYYGKKGLSKLHTIVKKYGLKITAFATGKTLEDNPDIIEILDSLGAEVEQHSYSHKVGHGTKLGDIQKGIETHKRLLGKDPLGYRAPQGIINKEEMHLLEKMGILFDSSIYPTYFPGRFNRLKYPTMPFKVKGSSLIEIPFSVIPKVRIPLGLSYIQMIGFGSFLRLLKMFGIPNLVVFDFHPYELAKVPSFSLLPLIPKIGYLRSQKLYNDPSLVFEEFVKFVLESGYTSKYLFEVFEEFKLKAPIWDWTGD
jgi:peptidoglycan/xylan/chitin deacetylase (PgdA/CDA1 family)